MTIKNCAPEKCNKTEKRKNNLGFFLFAEIRSSGKKRNVKANERNEAVEGRRKKMKMEGEEMSIILICLRWAL
jgi:hypothetical protein